MNDDRFEEEESERPRPRVVDRRISARAAETDPSQAPPRPADMQSRPDPGGAASLDAAPPEHGRVEPPQADAPVDPAGASRADVWTPEQEAEARQMAEEIARTPSIEWVVQSAVSLANVAGIKLDLAAPADAQLAIDALRGIIDALGPRLAAAERPLRETLAQLQLAYAQRVGPPPPSPG